MSNPHCLSDDDLPLLKAIALPQHRNSTTSQPIRRSPRKHNPLNAQTKAQGPDSIFNTATLTAVSMQTRRSPSKSATTRRSPLTTIRQPRAPGSLFENVPIMPRKGTYQADQWSSTKQTSVAERPAICIDSLSLKMSKMDVKHGDSDRESDLSFSDLKSRKSANSKSVMSLMTEAARVPLVPSKVAARLSPRKVSRSTPQYSADKFILDEARCNDDLADSDVEVDGTDDENTDLSGFVVNDDAELSFHGSIQSHNDTDSEEERRRTKKTTIHRPRRRLQRGRRQVVDSEDEMGALVGGTNGDLADALQRMEIGGDRCKDMEHKAMEVIDLTSPIQDAKKQAHGTRLDRLTKDDLFKDFKAMNLSRPKETDRAPTPDTQHLTQRSELNVDLDTKSTKATKDAKLTTPPATPPRSPTKLRSPSKHILSPSKRTNQLPHSHHRPSLDAFWDHHMVNEFNDQYSPKKAPLISPRKLLDRFHLWSDGEDEGVGLGLNDSSDSLPSPCESPSKTKLRPSTIKSPEKAERKRIMEAKKAELERKKIFEASRDGMARELLEALDQNLTGSRLSAMTKDTGGVQIIWSAKLLSTAGRAEYRRVAQPTSSPVKSASANENKAPTTIVQHFATIELATKVIDRPERLVSTLTHEFCHLANYMVSGIRDNPHGKSFYEWGRKCIKWMREESGRAEWKNAEVATTHSYKIDFKYVWICTGRPRTMAMNVLNLEDEGGCGAEYGRHSKSVDTEKHRCGRCQGRLVQVQPKPRASPKKSSPVKGVQRSATEEAGSVTRSTEIIGMSDLKSISFS